jgi:hypothetical protein
MKRLILACAVALSLNVAAAPLGVGPLPVPPTPVADCSLNFHHPVIQGAVQLGLCVADGPHVMFLLTAVVDPLDFHTIKAYTVNSQLFTTYDKCQAAIEMVERQVVGSPLGNSGWCVQE